MKLSAEQSGSLIKSLNERIQSGQLNCPLCGKKQWILNEAIIETREFEQGGLFIGGNSSIMPFVTLTCRNCANTLFLNAIQLGLIPNAASKKENDNTEKQ